jgi:hypothetical protein
VKQTVEHSAFLIDWLTLRLPLGGHLSRTLMDRILSCLNTVTCCDSNGEVRWMKKALDIDALRSDTVGLCWMVQSDGTRTYLVIGASPASLEHGINVFGTLDIQHCARTLIGAAQKALRAFLPGLTAWQCRRIDVTGNYVLPDFVSVKHALKQLSLSDGGRRKATNKRNGGDSVYWNPSSDLVKGKAYHKGPQLALLRRRGKVECTDRMIEMADRLLRLEHTRGARWFRRYEQEGGRWFDLTAAELEGLYLEFFGKIVGGVEVRDMDRNELVKRIQDRNGITEGRAMAAFTTYRNIRQDGFDVVKGYMSRSAFFLHLKHLRVAGITDAELHSGNVIPFRPVRIILARPVTCWEDILVAA